MNGSCRLAPRAVVVSMILALALTASSAGQRQAASTAEPRSTSKRPDGVDASGSGTWADARGKALPAPLRVLHGLAATHDAAQLAKFARRLGVPMLDDRALVIFELDAATATAALSSMESRGASISLRSGGVVDPRRQRQSGHRHSPDATGAARRGREQAHVWLPLLQLEQAAATPGVVAVLPPKAARTHGVISEGVGAIDAAPWQAFDPPTGLPLGRPARVAVIDAGFLGHEALLGDDLPDSVTTTFFCPAGGGTNGCNGASAVDQRHGTAVAEIVHDVSPDSELILIVVDLQVGFNSNLQQAVNFANAQGADIVTMSIGTDFDNRDGTGPNCVPTNQVAAAGGVFTISSGNSGDVCEHEHYDLQLSGVQAGPPFGQFQAFPGKLDSIFNEFVLPAGETVVIQLLWNAFGAPPADDLDLVLSCDTGGGLTQVDGSFDMQCGQINSDPIEVVAFQNNTGGSINCGYRVVEFDPQNCPHPANRQFDTFNIVDSCVNMEENTSSFTVGHPADCVGGTAVGAVCAFNNQLEFFSSQGPTLDNRIKPELCAPDNTSGVSFGPSFNCSGANGFPGTSAAAPHVAGSLALLFEKIGGSFSVPKCLEILQARGVDITGDNSADSLCGSGRLCLSSDGCP